MRVITLVDHTGKPFVVGPFRNRKAAKRWLREQPQYADPAVFAISKIVRLTHPAYL